MKNNHCSRLMLAISIIVVLSVSNAASAPGDLDTTFNGGLVAFDVSTITQSVLIQPDGKIVSVGTYAYGGWSFIARNLPNGAPDFSFGVYGIVRVNIKEIYQLYQDVHVLPDGKYLIVGTHINGLALFRLTANGLTDLDYGVAGVRTIPGFSYGYDLTAQPDGKLVIAGESGLIRLNPDGSFDTGFGVGGAVKSGSFDKIILQSDGRILARSSASNQIVRFNENGTRDFSFGVNGRVIAIGADIYDLAVARDRIVVNSGSMDLMYIQKFSRDGIVLPGFNTVAIPGINLPHSYGPALEVAIQPNGKIVAAGDRNGIFSLWRFMPNGTVDSGFGIDGVANPPICTVCRIFAMELQPDGKIVVGGDVAGANYMMAAIARYHGDEPAIVTNRTAYDFDGDGRADQAVFRSSDSDWHLNGSKTGYSVTKFGLGTDELVPADFDGDGRFDIAVFRAGTWYWLASSNGSFNVRGFGVAGDVPIPADYNGDGRTELAIYRNGVWWSLDLASAQVRTIRFGLTSDIPVPVDFDGDGITDPVVFRSGVWHILASELGYTVANFGLAADHPVPADFDGDGRADLAVFRPVQGRWYVKSSATESVSSLNWGTEGDFPVPADYDGDGKTDIAVFRNGVWYISQSNGGTNYIAFGVEGDRPVNFRRLK